MRAWNVVGKYPIYTDGKVTHTEITLATMSGSYGTFTELVKNTTDSITQLMETLSLLEMPTEDVEEDGGQSNEN